MPNLICFDFDETITIDNVSQYMVRNDLKKAGPDVILSKIRNSDWLCKFIKMRKELGDYIYIVTQNRDRKLIEYFLSTLLGHPYQSIINDVLLGADCPGSISKNEFIMKALFKNKDIFFDKIILIDDNESHCEMAIKMGKWNAVYAKVGDDSYIAELDRLLGTNSYSSYKKSEIVGYPITHFSQPILTLTPKSQCNAFLTEEKEVKKVEKSSSCCHIM